MLMQSRRQHSTHASIPVQTCDRPGSEPTPIPPWTPFEAILKRLHNEGIYIHAEQLAEFYLAHGLPVDLCYVPSHLRSKAQRINQNYQGDMARLEEVREIW